MLPHDRMITAFQPTTDTSGSCIPQTHCSARIDRSVWRMNTHGL